MTKVYYSIVLYDLLSRDERIQDDFEYIRQSAFDELSDFVERLVDLYIENFENEDLLDIEDFEDFYESYFHIYISPFFVRKKQKILLELTVEERNELKDKLYDLGMDNYLDYIEERDCCYVVYNTAYDFIRDFYVDAYKEYVITDILCHLLTNDIKEDQVGKTVLQMNFENNPNVHVFSTGRVLEIRA